MIHLEKITWDGCDDIFKLKVAKEQKSFVAKSSESIIDAYFAITEEGKSVFPFGIYNDNQPVGFMMISYNLYGEITLSLQKTVTISGAL